MTISVADIHGQPVTCVTESDDICRFFCVLGLERQLKVRSRKYGAEHKAGRGLVGYTVFSGLLAIDDTEVEAIIEFNDDTGRICEIPVHVPRYVLADSITAESATLLWPDKSSRELIRHTGCLWRPKNGFLEGRIDGRLHHFYGRVL